jgi:hypothetical protein
MRDAKTRKPPHHRRPVDLDRRGRDGNDRRPSPVQTCALASLRWRMARLRTTRGRMTIGTQTPAEAWSRKALLARSLRRSQKEDTGWPAQPPTIMPLAHGPSILPRRMRLSRRLVQPERVSGRSPTRRDFSSVALLVEETARTYIRCSQDREILRTIIRILESPLRS